MHRLPAGSVEFSHECHGPRSRESSSGPSHRKGRASERSTSLDCLCPSNWLRRNERTERLSPFWRGISEYEARAFLAASWHFGNPFAEEDAQTDTVFKRRCLATVHHPAWNKFFGSPVDPSTALVFGEKGSGKTALRLQAESELESHNHAHPAERVFVISYDDFNPYLDNCKACLGVSEMEDVLAKWRLEDHMDAILSLAVTKLVDLLTSEKINHTVLRVDQRRDLLLLAALYDASTKAPLARRWSRLRRQSGFRPLWAHRDLQIGFGTTLAVIAFIAVFRSFISLKFALWLIVPLLAGWLYWAWRLLRASGLPGTFARASACCAAIPAPCGGSSCGSGPRSWEASPCPPLRTAARKCDTSCCASFKGFSRPWATRASWF